MDFQARKYRLDCVTHIGAGKNGADARFYSRVGRYKADEKQFDQRNIFVMVMASRLRSIKLADGSGNRQERVEKKLDQQNIFGT